MRCNLPKKSLKHCRTSTDRARKLKLWETKGKDGLKNKKYWQKWRRNLYGNRKIMRKNPAYGRHWISQRVWIVAPIQKEEENHLSHFMVFVSVVMRHASRVMCHVSPVTCQQSHVTGPPPWMLYNGLREVWWLSSYLGHSRKNLLTRSLHFSPFRSYGQGWETDSPVMPIARRI